MQELRADLWVLTMALGERGFRVNRKKTEFMAFNFSGGSQENVKLILGKEKIKRVENIKY